MKRQLPQNSEKNALTLSVFCRLLSRIIFIPFANIKREMNKEQSALWQQVFTNLLSKVSAVVGDLIAVGEWLTLNEGRQ